MQPDIQSFDRNYSQDLQKSGFLGNLGCTFSLVHTKIRVHNEKLVQERNPELSTSHTGPLIAMIAYRRYAVTTVIYIDTGLSA